MKLLGIDFGSKRVGVAISDEGGILAFPHSVIVNDKDLISRIEEIIIKEGVNKIVVGDSKDFEGKPNAIMDEANKFIEIIKEKTNLEVVLEPEFLSSYQVESFKHRRSDPRISEPRPKNTDIHSGLVDASAAAIILQSFLDKKLT